MSSARFTVSGASCAVRVLATGGAETLAQAVAVALMENRIPFTPHPRNGIEGRRYIQFFVRGLPSRTVMPILGERFVVRHASSPWYIHVLARKEAA